MTAPTLYGIAVDDAHLYLATNDANAGTILRLPKVATDAGTFDTIATGQKCPWAIAVDDRHVYWVNRVTTTRAGSVMRVARDGSCPAGLPCPEVLVGPGVPASDVPSGMVLLGNSIYFTTSGTGPNNGAVWKLAK